LVEERESGWDSAVGVTLVFSVLSGAVSFAV
jgi:hypothetical protein